MNDIPFSIEQVAELLQLQVKRRTAYQAYVNCPFCVGSDGEADKNGHLNINFVKNVFRCNRCNSQGGMLDLYSLYYGTSTKKAYKDIIERLKLGNEGVLPNKVVKTLPSKMIQESLSIEEKNKTYSKLLNLLTLSEEHRKNLQNRGLTDDEIDAGEYRSTPVVGLKRIALEILESGCKLKGVPGFYTDADNNWSIDIRGSGIMIPVRDDLGNIQGIQIRKDKSDRKYCWLTSNEKSNGTSAEISMHYVNMDLADKAEVFITEGPLKADIASNLSKKPFIAIPGSSCYKLLEKNLDKLKWYGVEIIVNAMDMDRYTNPNVMKNVEELKNVIETNGFKLINLKWDGKFKGIDDYLWDKKKKVS